MQSGEPGGRDETQMTVPPPPPPLPPSLISYPPVASLPAPSDPTTSSLSSSSSPPVSSPSLASSPPVTTHITPTSALLQLDKQASLAHKLRLNKVVNHTNCSPIPPIPSNPHDAPPPGSFTVRSTLIGEEEERGGDIRVLSPSLVNSQVLSKTRPLSPDIDNHVTNGHRLPPTPDAQTVSSGRRGAGPGCGDPPCCTPEEKTTKGRGRGRRRQRVFKLKFHHQALPPEYLDHYEASLRHQPRPGPAPAPPPPPTPPRQPREALPPDPHLARDASATGLEAGVPRQGRGGRGRGRGRGQRAPRPITIHEAGGAATEALLRELLLTRPHLQQAALQQAALARAQSVPSMMPHQPPSPAPPDSGSPYMGEMHLEGAGPRRGRKPKKTDLSHLTQSHSHPGPPHPHEAALHHHLQQLHRHLQQQQQQQQQQHAGLGSVGGAGHRAGDSDGAMEEEVLPRAHSYTSLLHTALTEAGCGDQREPLNLCVRDAAVKLEPPHPTDPPPPTTMSPELAWSAARGGGGVPSAWFNDYRLKSEDGLSSGQSTPSMCSQSSHLPSLSPPAFPHMSPPPPMPSPRLYLPPHFLSSPHPPGSPSPVPGSPLPAPPHARAVHALLKESLQQRLDEAARERLSPQQAAGRGSRGGGGARRKRSALFIPPADPNSEVSICKFKFTGGANPMLEEKKVVNLDAGGTMRCLGSRHARSGATHRDLHHIPTKLLDNITKCEKDVKKIRLESDTEDGCSAATSPVSTLERGLVPPNLAAITEDSPKRKRRSKKSSVRERLEATLRERGLLIQTQQIESAQGATYCKFRQLRKFTRYLFRSWKDYLPGQLQDIEGEHLPPYPDTTMPHHHTLPRRPPSPDPR